MIKPVAITADTPIDLSPEDAARFNITTIPLHVTLGDKSFSDGIDIVPEDIFKNYDENHTLPKTSAISVGEYEAFFKSFTDKGYAVVHLSLSSGISSTYQNAVIASEDMEDVYVVDTLQLSTGMAVLGIKGTEMRDKGIDAKTIYEKLLSMRELVVTSFVIDTLEYLYKGGRCSALSAFGANLFNIKPSIIMPDGCLHVGKKYRGKIDAVQVQYINETLKKYDDIDYDRIFITHTGTSPKQVKALKKVIAENCSFREILESTAGCTVTAHCGKNTMGILFMRRPS